MTSAAPGLSWVLMVAVGFGCTWAMTHTDSKLLDMILIRFAAASWIAAGMIGAVGWLGDWMRSATTWVTRNADHLGHQAIGTSIVWIITAGVALLWVGAMLPDRLFSYDPPDWLLISGLVLPSLLVAVPGHLGVALRGATEWAGHGAQHIVGGWVA